MDHHLVPYGGVNGLISSEERHANKEGSKRRWEEEEEESFVWWSQGECGRFFFERIPPPKFPHPTMFCCLPFVAC